MFCPQCGAPLSPGAKSCSNCGAPVPEAPDAPSRGPSAQGSDARILRVVCGVPGALFALYALYGVFEIVRTLINNIKGLSGLFYFFGPNGTLVYIITSMLSLLLGTLVIAVAAVFLLLGAAKWDPRHNDLILCGLAFAAILRAILLVLHFLFNSLLRVFCQLPVFVIRQNIFFDLTRILIYVAVVGVVFGVMYWMGCPPFLGETLEEIKDKIRASLSDLTANRGKPGPKASTPGTAAPTAPAPDTPAAARPMNTNRGIIIYILLCFVTLGFYSWFFVHGLAKDINEVCAGDGRKTAGLLPFILLNLVTCGIYSLVWYYMLCNRMAANAPRYGLTLRENGTTFLLWALVGSLLCGLGPLIALHFVCRGANALCAAYNQRNGLDG